MAVLDPAKIAGKIVVCDRGVTARVNKSLAVQQAGGLGMLLLNTSANSINADFHFVPTVHLQNTDRAAVKAYAATGGATAAINEATLVYNAAAPFTASFSSRGPLVAGHGDLLKPDLMAPGQDILAGVSPAGYNGRLFDTLSGTSMSSPHVAGLAALFKELKPGWSPMAIKSALMTTGVDVLDGGTPPAAETNPVLIFRQGAGHVQPNAAVNPGLVFDSNFSDWLAFICGVQPGGGCTGVTPIDASNLNTASIAIGDMAGAQTVKRRVTNVGGNPATYTASVNGMAGFTTVVSPSSLTLAVGQTKEFTVTFTRTTAALNAYAGGQLRLSDGTRTVRVPMVSQAGRAGRSAASQRLVQRDLRLRRCVHSRTAWSDSGGHGTRCSRYGWHRRYSGHRPSGYDLCPFLAVRLAKSARPAILTSRSTTRAARSSAAAGAPRRTKKSTC